jgi:hypothetical protein
MSTSVAIERSSLLVRQTGGKFVYSFLVVMLNGTLKNPPSRKACSYIFSFTSTGSCEKQAVSSPASTISHHTACAGSAYALTLDRRADVLGRHDGISHVAKVSCGVGATEDLSERFWLVYSRAPSLSFARDDQSTQHKWGKRGVRSTNVLSCWFH